VSKENAAKNAMRIISVLNAYYGNNAYYVRIKGVLSTVLNRYVLKRVQKKEPSEGLA